MLLKEFMRKLKSEPQSISFNEVIDVIEREYDYSPSEFSNGNTINLTGTNEGSCKILYFGQLHELTKEQTLSCFGQYYRDDVLNNPDGNDHCNIRQFIKLGWSAINFKHKALKLKEPSLE